MTQDGGAASRSSRAPRADKTETFRAEKILMAVGRKPLSDGIGLEGVGRRDRQGLHPGRRRHADERSRHLRDRRRRPDARLAHVASAEGVVAVEHMAGRETRPINYDQVPGCTYCSPEVGSIGLTEAKARERGYDVVVGKFPFSAIGKARILNETSGFVKIVGEKKYDEVLGVHIIGPKATELIAEAGAALRLEATSEELVRTIHAHPTLSEAMHEAAEAVEGHADPHLASCEVVRTHDRSGFELVTGGHRSRPETRDDLTTANLTLSAVPWAARRCLAPSRGLARRCLDGGAGRIRERPALAVIVGRSRIREDSGRAPAWSPIRACNGDRDSGAPFRPCAPREAARLLPGGRSPAVAPDPDDGRSAGRDRGTTSLPVCEPLELFGNRRGPR